MKIIKFKVSPFSVPNDSVYIEPGSEGRSFTTVIIKLRERLKSKVREGCGFSRTSSLKFLKRRSRMGEQYSVTWT